MMTAAEAEAIIRRTLDGRFFIMGFTAGPQSIPRVYVKKVAADFLPLYHLIPNATEEAQQHKAAAVVKKHRPWTAEEAKRLIALRQAGVRWDFIAREIKRCNRAVMERYDELAAELSLPAVVSKQGHFTKMTDEQRAEVVRRRDAGESFGEIGRAMGLRDFMARDCYHRHQRMLKDRRNQWVPA
jgi:hypothetical protein